MKAHRLFPAVLLSLLCGRASSQNSIGLDAGLLHPSFIEWERYTEGHCSGTIHAMWDSFYPSMRFSHRKNRSGATASLGLRIKNGELEKGCYYLASDDVFKGSFRFLQLDASFIPEFYVGNKWTCSIGAGPYIAVTAQSRLHGKQSGSYVKDNRLVGYDVQLDGTSRQYTSWFEPGIIGSFRVERSLGTRWSFSFSTKYYAGLMALIDEPRFHSSDLAFTLGVTYKLKGKGKCPCEDGH